jgi:hypothetical protein
MKFKVVYTIEIVESLDRVKQLKDIIMKNELPKASDLFDPESEILVQKYSVKEHKEYPE